MYFLTIVLSHTYQTGATAVHGHPASTRSKTPKIRLSASLSDGITCHDKLDDRPTLPTLISTHSPGRNLSHCSDRLPHTPCVTVASHTWQAWSKELDAHVLRVLILAGPEPFADIFQLSEKWPIWTRATGPFNHV